MIKESKDIGTKIRYNQIRKYVKETAKNLKKKITEDTQYEDFIKYELESQKKLFKKYLKGSNVNFKFPTIEQAITTATFGQYTATSNFENYLDSLESQFFNIWDSNVREGYLIGISTQDIVRKVVGTQAKNAKLADAGAMGSFVNSITANTRTALQAMASDTRRLIYQQNEDVIDGYRWLATLDRRTCLVCGANDGKEVRYLNDFKEQVPLHYNCRCIIVPIIKGFEELKDDSRVNSKEGYSYKEWFNNQDEDIQKDILGTSRYELYKSGKVDISSFSQDSKIIKLNNFGIISKYKDITFNEIKNKDDIDKLLYNSNFIFEKSITNNDKQLLKSYTGIYSESINNSLRNRNNSFIQNVKYKINKDKIKQLDSILDNYITDDNIKVFRAVNSKYYLTNMKKGSIFTDLGYSSCSLIKNGIEGYAEYKGYDTIFEIDILKGKRVGAYINDYSFFKDIEYEFLLKRNTVFRVIDSKKESGYNIVKLEIL